MKKQLYTFACSAALLILSACDAISYEGEYSKDGYYNTKPRVYLETTDSVKTCSFSLDENTVETKTMMIPLKIMGKKAESPMEISLEVDPTSTAKEGQHYQSIAPVILEKDSLVAYIKVEAIPKNLPTVEQGNYFLILHIKPTDKYETDKNFVSSVKIKFDDYLAKPEWWDTLFDGVGKAYYYGEYTREKYTKWLSYYNYNREAMDLAIHAEDYTAWLYGSFREVYKYFTAHPELGQTFGPYASYL